MNFNYESWIKQAKDRLELLYEQKNSIENEISALERGIEGFLPLAKAAWIGPSAGITESVRKILSGNPHALYTPVHVRDELLQQGVALRQKNAMATIHQVLSRLVEKGLVKVHIDKGKNHYRWIGENGEEDVMKQRTRSKATLRLGREAEPDKK